MTLSVIIIALNERDNIRDCLASVAFADECIVLDGGSTDDTAHIANSMKAKVFINSEWQGFGHQKNIALSHAQSDWILSLDADERITPELALEIQHAMSTSNADVFEIARQTNFCGTWIRHCGWTPDRVARLFKRGSVSFTADKVHERLTGPGMQTVGRLKQVMLHFSYPTPAHYWRKLQTYSQAWAEQKFAQGQTTSIGRACLSAVAAFVKSYFLRLGFLDGAMGLVVCNMQAQAAFGKYFTLYYLNRTNP
jgi:glycosyltransferase involved in cell wall biosynthesis